MEEEKVELSEYEKQRNRLIPLAVRYADQSVHRQDYGGSEEEEDKYRSHWNKVYHTEMNDLWRELGR